MRARPDAAGRHGRAWRAGSRGCTVGFALPAAEEQRWVRIAAGTARDAARAGVWQLSKFRPVAEAGQPAKSLHGAFSGLAAIPAQPTSGAGQRGGGLDTGGAGLMPTDAPRRALAGVHGTASRLCSSPGS